MLKLKALIILCFLPALLFAQQHFDIILKNGKIIDGTGNPWFYGDVGIIKDKIISIGDLSKNSSKAAESLEGLVGTDVGGATRDYINNVKSVAESMGELSSSSTPPASGSHSNTVF